MSVVRLSSDTSGLDIVCNNLTVGGSITGAPVSSYAYLNSWSDSVFNTTFDPTYVEISPSNPAITNSRAMTQDSSGVVLYDGDNKLTLIEATVSFSVQRAISGASVQCNFRASASLDPSPAPNTVVAGSNVVVSVGDEPTQVVLTYPITFDTNNQGVIIEGNCATAPTSLNITDFKWMFNSV